jgi:hypothetical protein
MPWFDKVELTSVKYSWCICKKYFLTIKHINFVQNKASGSATQLFPIGALTKEVKEEMAELFDMKIVERLPLEIIIKVKTMLICLKSR